MNTPDICALCGAEDRPVFVIRDRKRVYLSACALCLLTAADALTGYHFVRQYHQWEALRAVHAEKKRRDKAGWTGPQKGGTYAEILSKQAES